MTCTHYLCRVAVTTRGKRRCQPLLLPQLPTASEREVECLLVPGYQLPDPPPPDMRHPTPTRRNEESIMNQPLQVLPSGVVRWELLADGAAARDATTGLIWKLQPVADGARFPWAAAKEAAAGVRLLDRTDWRLPSIRELLSIVDYERYSHALCEVFRVPESGWVWAATPFAEYPESDAWSLYLYGGVALVNPQDDRGFALAVCGPVPSPGQ